MCVREFDRAGLGPREGCVAGSRASLARRSPRTSHIRYRALQYPCPRGAQEQSATPFHRMIRCRSGVSLCEVAPCCSLTRDGRLGACDSVPVILGTVELAFSRSSSTVCMLDIRSRARCGAALNPESHCTWDRQVWKDWGSHVRGNFCRQLDALPYPDEPSHKPLRVGSDRTARWSWHRDYGPPGLCAHFDVRLGSQMKLHLTHEPYVSRLPMGRLCELHRSALLYVSYRQAYSIGWPQRRTDCLLRNGKSVHAPRRQSPSWHSSKRTSSRPLTTRVRSTDRLGSDFYFL